MEEKGNQQQEALKMREEEYKQKTGKDFNPLVTDELEQPNPIPVNQPTAVKPPSPIKPPTPVKTPTPTNERKTRKNRLTPQEIQMKQMGPTFVNEDLPTPDQSQSKIYTGENMLPEDNYVDLMDGINNPTPNPRLNRRYNPNPNPSPNPNTRPVNSGSGFSETIVSKGPRIEGPQRADEKICPQIFATGRKINKTYFIPSQLPNLTKIKTELAKEDTKRGGRKTRKRIPRKNSRRQNKIGKKSRRK